MKIHLILSICLFVVGISLPASAQVAPSDGSDIDSHTVKTKFDGIRAFRALPKGFQAEKTSASELAANGLPARPDPKTAPQQYKIWSDLVTAARHRIIATLGNSNIVHGKIRNLTTPNQGPTTSANWSGFVILDPNAPFAKQNVLVGKYILPSVEDCKSNGLPRLYSSNWVGIDGDSSGDVLQLGTSADMNCPDGFPGHHQLYYSWFEWYPASSVLVTGWEVRPGDPSLLSVQVNTIGPHGYFVSLYDYRSNQGWATR